MSFNLRLITSDSDVYCLTMVQAKVILSEHYAMTHCNLSCVNSRVIQIIFTHFHNIKLSRSRLHKRKVIRARKQGNITGQGMKRLHTTSYYYIDYWMTCLCYNFPRRKYKSCPLKGGLITHHTRRAMKDH